MATKVAQLVSTCPCGSTDFEEVGVKLEMEVESVTGAWPRPVCVFMRTCEHCGQVTFWTESSRAHKPAEPKSSKDLLDRS